MVASAIADICLRRLQRNAPRTSAKMKTPAMIGPTMTPALTFVVDELEDVTESVGEGAPLVEDTDVRDAGGLSKNPRLAHLAYHDDSSAYPVVVTLGAYTVKSFSVMIMPAPAELTSSI